MTLIQNKVERISILAGMMSVIDKTVSLWTLD